MSSTVNYSALYSYIVKDPNVGIEEIAQICPKCSGKSLVTYTVSRSKDESDETIEECVKCGHKRYSDNLKELLDIKK